MNSFMMAFGWASIMLIVGTLLRAKVSFFRTMLVPASVIGGIIGIIFMNMALHLELTVGVDTDMFTETVNQLFTVSFISISLTSTPTENGGNVKNMFRGALGMGIVWCLLYGLTPILGAGLISILGERFDMPAIYGTLIPFAYAQGPGQAASFGMIYESYGYENAGMVAIAFAAIGFVIAFALGIPAARLGIKQGIAKNCGTINDRILKGYLSREEQTEYMVKDTTCNSNIETLTFHFALIGLSYILAVGISKILARIPGFAGASLSGLMFMNGMYAAYIIKFIMKKLHLDFLQENVLQSKITGWTADYLVVCAFMAVNIETLGKWLMPVLAEAIIIAAVTFIVCFYFGRRIGGSNDFERTLGLFGTSTGTVPSGIALVRIVDPQFRTSTSAELGMMNLVMLLSTPVYILLLAMASNTISMRMVMFLLVVCCLIYIILLKITKTWGKPTYTWKNVQEK